MCIRLVAERRGDQLESLRKKESERAASILSDRHDLRTPLHAVALGIQAMEMPGPVNPEQEEKSAWRSAIDFRRGLPGG